MSHWWYGGFAQLYSATAPSASSLSRAESVASAATRSISGRSGPVPRRVITRTCSPRSASRLAVAEPTGPAPTITCNISDP